MKDLNTTDSLDLSNAKSIYKTFKSDKIKNANIIIDLLKELEGTDVKKLRKALAVIHKIFCQLIKDGDLKEITHTHSNTKSSKLKYDKWLYERYIEVHEQLLKMVLNEEFPFSLREISMIIVMKLIQKETNYPVTKEKIHDIDFPIEKLKQLYNTLLSSESTSCSLIKKLRENLQLPDFLFASLYILAQIVSNSRQEDMNPSYQENLMSLLELINLPEERKKPLNPPNLFIHDNNIDKESSEDGSRFNFPHKEAKKLFNVIWETVLKLKLNAAMYKHCLVVLPEKVMMHLEEPVRLTDFFMNAYNLGGGTSLLAMHGVYILITQYNLEYPDFYDKVYAMFQPTIFHAKFKPRFFILCNKFFLSPYLPEYIIAAFIKRSCRLMLTAPSSCLILLLKFVINLLLRFPSLKRLLNNPNTTSVQDDPFVADEPSTLLCRAGESSLWEVATLRQHPLCGVSKSANFIIRNLPDVEHDLTKYVEKTYEDLYEKASKIKEPRVATTFYKPEGLFIYSDDTMSSTWEII